MAARRTRQISIKECYDILRLQKGATLQDVKTAYRKRAFELHPDLNPGNAEAGRQFQLLNEAYVALSAILKPAEEATQKTDGSRKQGPETAAKEAKKDQGEEQKEKEKEKAASEQEKASAAYAEQDVLRDLLNDPFARRVFEDIYSELNKKQERTEQQEPQAPPQPESPKPEKKQQAKTPRRVQTLPPVDKSRDKGVGGAIKGWLRRQIDEEQTLTMPAARLRPGAKIRLQIRKGLSEDVSAIDVTLPPDFVVGKPLRLRGLGKKVGPWQGDLYLTIFTE